MSIFADTLSSTLGAFGIAYTQQQLSLCETYYKLVMQANAHINLTRITGEVEAALRHFADAARLFNFLDIPSGCHIIDIGAGAGFPGLPVKIFRPDTDVTLLDSSAKKTDFIKTAAADMHIDITVICSRAEEAAQGDLRESFDIALSRAVAPLNMLLELCVPFVRTGGMLAAWKGASFEEELSGAADALDALGCAVRGVHFIDPGAIVLIEKQKPTPDIYPRRFAKIKSSPL